MFSLLFLCSTGGRIAPVDYTNPLDEFAIHKLAQDPDRVCFCSIVLVLNTVSPHLILRASNSERAWVEIENSSDHLSSHICLDSVCHCTCRCIHQISYGGSEHERFESRPDGTSFVRISCEWIVAQHFYRSPLCSSVKHGSKALPARRSICLGRESTQIFPVENVVSQDSLPQALEWQKKPAVESESWEVLGRSLRVCHNLL